MTTRAWICLGLVSILAGCSMTNRSYVKQTYAKLPNGDEISAIGIVEVAPVGIPHHASTDQSYVEWRRVAPVETLIQIKGQGDLRMREVARILTVVQDDTIIKMAPGQHALTSEQIGQSKLWYEMETHAVLHVSPDGNRAWLTYKGQPFASFDYLTATANFGTQNQPSWAEASEK